MLEIVLRLTVVRTYVLNSRCIKELTYFLFHQKAYSIFFLLRYDSFASKSAQWRMTEHSSINCRKKLASRKDLLISCTSFEVGKYLIASVFLVFGASPASEIRYPKYQFVSYQIFILTAWWSILPRLNFATLRNVDIIFSQFLAIKKIKLNIYVLLLT